MRHPIQFVLAASCAGSLMMAANSAAAYSPKWLECDGQSVTTALPDGKPDTKPLHETYVYDDDSHNFYKYEEAGNRTAIEPTTEYTNDIIKWAETHDPGQSAPTWTGELNRGTLALKINYRDPKETMDVAEQCKAGTPHPGAE